MRLRRYQPDDESVDDLDAVIIRHKKPRNSGVFLIMLSSQAN